MIESSQASPGCEYQIFGDILEHLRGYKGGTLTIAVVVLTS